jgi:hypothetical protein
MWSVPQFAMRAVEEQEAQKRTANRNALRVEGAYATEDYHEVRAGKLHPDHLQADLDAITRQLERRGIKIMRPHPPRRPGKANPRQ